MCFDLLNYDEVLEIAWAHNMESLIKPYQIQSEKNK